MNNITKLLSLILILSILFSFCVLPSKAQNEDALPIITAGDFNCDNKLNAIDLVLIKRELLGMTTGYDTVMADASGNGIFDLRDLSILKNILVGNSNLKTSIVGNVDKNKNITLSGLLSEGTYTLKYEHSLGVIEDYADIGSLKITSSKSNAVYDDLIAQNCAPLGATVIGVYNSKNKKVGFIRLGSLEMNLGEKLYSFGAFSDVHLQNNNGEEDYKRALEYLNDTENVAFNILTGDLTKNGTIAEFEKYRDFVKLHSPNTRIYEITGNHELYGNLNLEPIIESYTDEPLYYSFEHGNDVFIMLGMNSYGLFSYEELQWLYETLEENKDKRCFVFEHVNLDNGAGNPYNISADNDLWSNTSDKTATFEALINKYPNIVLFNGHTHITAHLQSLVDNTNYSDFYGCHEIHIPSLNYPRTGTSEGPSSKQELPMESEGYVIDVYENGILLRCRDFVREKFLPIATYYLDTKTDVKSVKQPFIKANWQTDAQNSNVAFSQMIEIEADTEYRVTATDTEFCSISVDYYDKNKNHLGNKTLADKGITTIRTNRVSQNSGAKYLKIKITAMNSSISIDDILKKITISKSGTL